MAPGRAGVRAVAPVANVTSLVPDITAGTGTESDETPGWWWPVGLSQSEGAHEMAVSVDGALFRVPGHLGVGRPSIYTTAFLAGNPVNFPHLARVGPLYDKPVSRPPFLQARGSHP